MCDLCKVHHPTAARHCSTKHAEVYMYMYMHIFKTTRCI
jgi:hypothetical protein